MPQPLPSKDQANFRAVVRLYEAKQYKKAIKTADGILKKTPNHGETQAMKALTLNSQGHTEEAFPLAKIALQNDMKSHITWHVYGLLWRHVKNYDEAIRAYKMALRIEPESPQILRDLAFQQMQMRDHQGYIGSRKLMLQAKPTNRQNWTALAVAYHLAGELKAAEDMLTTYEGTLKQTPPRTDTEHSEAVLYKNMIIEETGDLERALEHLDTIYKSNLDRTAVMETKARLLLKLGRKTEAEAVYRALINRNGENRLYYESLEGALGLQRSNKADHSKLAELYESFASHHERLNAARRIPLDFLTDEAFQSAADKYLHRMLSKGVPSTFTNIKGLYSDKQKRDVILGLVEGYLARCDEPSQEQANGVTSDRLKESCLFFLAQHFSWKETRDLEKAKKYCKDIMALPKENKSMTVMYQHTLARISKHEGNVAEAAEIMEKARSSDEKDRYINTKCAKYQLRNNQNELALSTMSKFTRNEAVGGALGDLHDMQCMWFLIEDGMAYRRRNMLGLALKRYKAVYDIFDTWYDDQFDFHFFSIRKGPIRSYVELVRWEDHLREHPFFTRAAIAAVDIYVKLHDDPSLAGPRVNGVANFDQLDANEKKRALKKAKKEQEKQEKIEAEKREAEKKAQKNQKKDPDADVKKPDLDPEGKKLLETKTPLDDAIPFVTYLLDFSPKNIESQLAGFDVYIRKGKLLLALRCLHGAHQIAPSHPGLHERLIRFRKTMDTSEKPSPKVAEVLAATGDIVPKSSELKEINEKFLQDNRSNAAHVFSAVRSRNFLDGASKSQNEKDLVSILDSQQTSLADIMKAFEIFKELKSDEATISKFREDAKKQWPSASCL